MRRPIRTALVVAGLQLAAALLATAAHTRGYIDGDVVLRIVMVATGLMMLFYANFASKAVSRSARFIAVNRFAGWSMAMGALAWTAIWLFAPMEIANLAAMAAVALGMLATVTYCFYTRPTTTP